MSAPSVAQQKAITAAAGRRYGISPAVLWGVYGTETNFGHNLGPSSAGALGYMQFEPGTAKSYGVNPYDFRSSMFGAARYLSQYKNRGLAGMLSAYNAGPAGALQPSYVASVRKNAASFGGPSISAGSGLVPQTTTSFSGGKLDTKAAGIAALLAEADKPINTSGKVSSGHLLSQLAANLQSGQFTTPSTAHTHTTLIPQGTGGTMHSGGVAGDFLPSGAKYIVGRKDQGRDGTTNPGGAIIAPGDGYVVRIGYDPSGFGPRYPIVHFTSGRYAGKTLYLGHTLSVVGSGAHFHRGQVLSHTGTHGVGNATVPGWFEIGYAPGGTPGAFGQAVPF